MNHWTNKIAKANKSEKEFDISIIEPIHSKWLR